jgi:type 1 glutamine amidotransferase
LSFVGPLSSVFDNADPVGNAIEVLAEATSLKSGKTFPQVFVVKHPKARIVGITLGHDGRAHDLPAYQTLLRNSVLPALGGRKVGSYILPSESRLAQRSLMRNPLFLVRFHRNNS